MTAQTKDDINLLPQKGFETSTAGRVLAWVLSTFRIIVIFTELIVMSAFLLRFWLDAQNSDLGDEIDEKQAVLAASLSSEKEFKDNQKRLGVYKEFTSRKYSYNQVLKEITKSFPGNVFLTSIDLAEDKIELDAVSSTERDIQQTIVNLSGKTIFKEVKLLDASTDKGNPSLIKFKLEILIN